MELFFGGTAAIGLGVVAALATGVLSGEQVRTALFGVADRVPAPSAAGPTTGSALTLSGGEDDDELGSRSQRVHRQAVAVAGTSDCADPGAIRAVVQRYSQWADGDLALIACRRIRSGFTGDQVIASLGEPRQRVRRLDGAEEWRYGTRSVVIRGGQVVGDSSR